MLSKRKASDYKKYLPSLVSFVLLIAGIIADNAFDSDFFKGPIRLLWYGVAYLPVGLPVLRKGFVLITRGKVFTEFFLMSVATIGAFFIGEYPEGVAVMLFYTIGELFQDDAVDKAKRSIKALLDIRPRVANVMRGGNYTSVSPEEVLIGEVILIKAGEQVALDGVMLSDRGAFNTSALTGESRPSTIARGEPVLAGMVNTGKVTEVKIIRKYEDSSLAKILYLVQEATQKKAPTEQFIRKFAKIYTPIVVYLAIALVFLPYFFAETYVFEDWLYRGMIFLVISCPCAFVISIPLGYFGGIGAASRHGVLFKGSNYLDLITKIDTVVMDKTGTLTKGVFRIKKIDSGLFDETEFMKLVGALESHSTHPIARAVTEYTGRLDLPYQVVDVEESAGHGLSGTVNGKNVLAGNQRLLEQYNIDIDQPDERIVDTVVYVAIDHRYAGYFTVADEIKEDALQTVKSLHALGIRDVIMLSGDHEEVVREVATELGLTTAYGGLLPEDKVEKVASLKAEGGRTIAAVGDGINDAPILAMADIGIAMGGLGSDAAIETADVILQTDQPSKLLTAISIGKATRRIVWQNIGLAFGVKLVVLVLGAFGLATMWEAVFADVGVALLAILNAVRLQRMEWE
ncbi:MAG: cadmium-translocating P-type ATPase [Bacteroidetes bacterium]|nr:MAG: cadmium-translocating P-type ATPase [Bacteroidota bacterium]